MARDKKAEPFNGKWAIITLYKFLPSKTEQITRARVWGVTESTLGRADISALFIDDVRKVRSTNWMGKLEKRKRFLEVMAELKPSGDQVFFATPLCVGWSAHLAEQTIRGLWDVGMEVYIHAVKANGPALYQPGDDLTELLQDIENSANAAHQRKHRES